MFNPALAARLVMRSAAHVLMVGKGVLAFSGWRAFRRISFHPGALRHAIAAARAAGENGA
ncbi:hypothetical protein KCP73_03050 [Salmonella enterica subsp. enterica]|nr:hypothetical protein KCP73_03050 [Salmonella enterica subsp. enterica]